MNEYKFGEKVLVWKKDLQGKLTMYFLANPEPNVFLVVAGRTSMQMLKEGGTVTVSSFPFCDKHPFEDKDQQS